MGLSLDQLVLSASEWVDMDLADLPAVIITPFGQTIKVVDDSGVLANRLTIEKIGCRPSVISRWGVRVNANPYIEWIARGWALDFLRQNLQVRSVHVQLRNIRSLRSASRDPERVACEILKWTRKLAGSGSTPEIREALISARAMYGWALDEGLPGFDELAAQELCELTPIKRADDSLVSMRDVVEGPFTRMELHMIESALADNAIVSLRQKAAFLLARDWGLRPVQIALIASEDLGEDDLGQFVNVCSVKGKTRSRLRRSVTNRVKRYIADDTASTLSALSVESAAAGEPVRERVRSLIGDAIDRLPSPLFPALRRTDSRIVRMCRDKKLIDYVLFADAWQVGHDLRTLTEILALPNPRLGLLGSEDEVLKISAMRLRRTKGTSMVVAGASIEDVAEALDHVGTTSVAHYFRYNTDVHELINRACARSPEFAEAVTLWEGKIVSKQEHVKDAIVSGLGSCKLGRPCPHHPTVSCYACQMFRPWKEVDHRKSLEDIKALRETMGKQATGPFARQLDAAVFGAGALVTAITGEADK